MEETEKWRCKAWRPRPSSCLRLPLFFLSQFYLHRYCAKPSGASSPCSTQRPGRHSTISMSALCPLPCSPAVPGYSLMARENGLAETALREAKHLIATAGVLHPEALPPSLNGRSPTGQVVHTSPYLYEEAYLFPHSSRFQPFSFHGTLTRS